MKLGNLLITGGCGFIGSNLIGHLVDKQCASSIRVLDNETTGDRSSLSNFPVELMIGDIRDKAALRAALHGIDTVVHLAADTRVIDSIANPSFNFEVNVQGTFNLLEEMRQSNVNRLINASTGGAIIGDVAPPVHEGMVANPASAYGASKAAVEAYCSAYAGSYGLNTTSLRFSNVYGPKCIRKGSVVAAFYKNILRGEPCIVYGDGSQQRDYIFVEDLCDGIIAAIEAEKSGVFQLGSGVGTSVNQLLEIMQSIVPAIIDIQYQDFRAGELLHNYADISKSKRELNFNPTTKLEKGLLATWKWLEENLGS